MFKLFVVVSTLLAMAVARPGYLSHHAPTFYYSAPATAVIHEPYLTKVGSIVKSIPTSVSHQSSSVVHSSAILEQPILAHGVKTHVLHAAAPIHSYPILHSSHSAGWW